MNNLRLKEQNLKAMMTNKVKALQALLGDQEKAKKFMAGALQVGLNNDLAQCSEESIVNAVMSVAMLDLSVDKNVGHAYLIKYGTNVQLQISYKGWLNLLLRAGYEVRTFPIFECDEFECSFNGWDYDFNLTPDFNERDIGNFEWEFKSLKGVLVVSKDLSTNDFKKDFITKKTIEKMRKSSSNQKTDTPTYIWKEWYIDMCCKSAIKKFKNQLVLRDNFTPLANGFENEEFSNKQIDYKETVKQGVIIEAEIEDKQEDNQPDLNSIQQAEENPKTTQEILLEELLKADVPEDKALLMLNENTDKHETWLKDKDDMHNKAMEYLF